MGGELPWASPRGMPPSFAAAVKEMKKGEVFKTPVRTDAGWHVVRLLDSRDAVPPPFENVQQDLVESVRNKQFTAYTDSLVEKAKITKTQDELACLRMANAMTEAAMEAALRFMRPGGRWTHVAESRHLIPSLVTMERKKRP